MICKKYILIIIILAVVFLPQCFVYASDTEITDKIEQQMLEKIDMSEIEKYSKDYLPDRLSFFMSIAQPSIISPAPCPSLPTPGIA